MTNYYVDVDEELAADLQQVESEAIVEALSDLARPEQDQNDSDELSQYQSLSELRADDSISAAEKKRRELHWQRRIGSRTRHKTQ
jgi:hypothetical protein